jgi:hypothetical protein
MNYYYHDTLIGCYYMLIGYSNVIKLFGRNPIMTLEKEKIKKLIRTRV